MLDIQLCVCVWNQITSVKTEPDLELHKASKNIIHAKKKQQQMADWVNCSFGHCHGINAQVDLNVITVVYSKRLHFLLSFLMA